MPYMVILEKQYQCSSVSSVLLFVQVFCECRAELIEVPVIKSFSRQSDLNKQVSATMYVLLAQAYVV